MYFDPKEVGKRIAKLRELLGYNQEQYSKKSTSVGALYPKLRLVTEVPLLIYLLKLQSCLELHWTI